MKEERKIKKCYYPFPIECANYSEFANGCIKNGKCEWSTKKGANKKMKKVCKALKYIYSDNSNLNSIIKCEIQ